MVSRVPRPLVSIAPPSSTRRRARRRAQTLAVWSGAPASRATALATFSSCRWLSYLAHPLKRKRAVEIRVTRPNVELTYNKEYTLKPPPKTIK